MKKKTFIAILAVVFAVMAMPQNAVAKEKKVTYLGHEYQGEVDENNNPCGKGVMNVGGLIIEGFFDPNSAKEALVYKHDYINNPKTKYQGTVLFDESDGITLAAGGTYLFFIYYKVNSDNIINTSKDDGFWLNVKLTRDCSEINYDSFELDEMPVKDKFKPVFNFRDPDDLKELNPSELPFLLHLKMKSYYEKDKKQNDKLVPVKAFVYSDNYKKPDSVVNSKDDQGRIWNWKGSNSWSVIYPDSSFIVYNRDENTVKDLWKIGFPDGRVYECKKGHDISVGNGFRLEGSLWNGKFVKFKNSNSSLIPDYLFQSSNELDLYSDNYDLEKLSDIEVNKLIKENVFLAYNPKEIFIRNKDGKKIGLFKDGSYLSYAQKEANDKAEAKRQGAYWTKKLGFNPLGKPLKSIIKSGSSFAAIKEFYSQEGSIRFDLSIDHGSSKCYDIIDRLAYPQRNLGYIWVSGNKITTVAWH